MKTHFIETLESRIAPAGLSSIDLGQLDGTDGFTLNGAANSKAGTSVANAGDVNGDGFDDLIIGAPNSGNGAAYVVFGKKTGLPAALDLGTLDGTNGFAITGEFTTTGKAVAGIGDFNDDGFDDVAVSATLGTPGSTGIVYIVYGHSDAFSPTLPLTTLGAAGTKLIGPTGDVVGNQIANAGDFNGDGISDIIFGAQQAKDNGVVGNGAAFVVFGKSGGLGNTFNLSAINGTNGFKTALSTMAPNANGRAVAGAGDVNGDGYDDVIVTAPAADAGGTFRGAAYVIFGKPSGVPPFLELSTLTAANGFRVTTTTDQSRLGDSAAGIGDLNGDGFDDIAIGEVASADDTAGIANVIFGHLGGFGTSIAVNTLDGTNGVRFIGTSNGDFFGSLGTRGDFNGDGLADLVVGATGASEVGTDSGAAYVFYGKKTWTATVNAASLDGTSGLKLRGAEANDNTGAALAAGDFNGDGFDDILVGSEIAGPGSQGAAYAVYGFGNAVKFSADKRMATFTDVDGDLVTVKVTKGALTRQDFDLTLDGVFQKLTLQNDNGAFTGTTLTITAKKAVGGTGDGKVNVGAIDARGVDLAAVMVGGNVGQIDAGDANPLTPGVGTLTLGSLGGNADTQPAGTPAPFTSRIEGAVKSVTVTDDLIGTLDVRGKLGAVKVGGDLGVFGGATAAIVRASGDLTSIAVSGNFYGGLTTYSGIQSGGKLGSVKITGDLVVGSTANPTIISAQGKTNPKTAAEAIAIGSVSIGGASQFARILAGYSNGLAPVNGDAGIGSVTFGAGIVGTSVVAGVIDTSVKNNYASPADGFGRNDSVISGGNASISSRIGSIVVKGNVTANANFFGFVAEQIAKVTVAGKAQALTAGKDNLGILGAAMNTTNVNILEV